jgi:uncharacterized membrane protein YdjX (TVP38/TMEM64 family)
MTQIAQKRTPTGGNARLKRLAPLGVLIAVIVLVFASGLNRQITFDNIAIQYGALERLVAGHALIAPLAAIAIYALATAVSLPAGSLLTVTAGLVFGWILASIVVVIGATIGACLLFMAAATGLAGFFRERAGDRLNAMAEGFRKDATSYMLFLRLTPIFPFWLVNAVPAILGVRFLTFAWTTFVGIIPGTIAFAFAGEGLRSIVATRAEACAQGIDPCGTPLGAGDLVTPQILIALSLLGLVSLLPVLLKRLRRGRPGGSGN